jgi:cell wall-associated NlpC family hydrolase
MPKGLIVSLVAACVLFAACSPAARFTSAGSNTIAKTKISSKKSKSTKKKKSKTPTFSELRFSGSESPLQKSVLNEAKKWLGTPYCYGGENKKCTDCSGFVQTVFSSIGMQLPRTAAQQFAAGESISEIQAEPGDLVFFKKSGRINHVGIYAGDDMFIHASSSRGVVLQSLNDKYYSSKFAGFKRFLTI